MEGPLYRLLILSRSINKHGHYRQFLFLIGRFKNNLNQNLGCRSNRLRGGPYGRGPGVAQGPQKLWGKWCKILHSGHILAHKSQLQIVGVFLLIFLLDKSQYGIMLWIKRCKNMLSGHFLAHKPAFLNLLFNKDNFDFWLDS
jgi:hypothetical protein